MIFGLVYTGVVGQTDDDGQCSSRERTATSRNARKVAELVLLGTGDLIGCGSYCCFGGRARVVVDWDRAIGPDEHVARRTHADQCGSADRGSSNSATPAPGNRELYDG